MVEFENKFLFSTWSTYFIHFDYYYIRRKHKTLCSLLRVIGLFVGFSKNYIYKKILKLKLTYD